MNLSFWSMTKMFNKLIVLVADVVVFSLLMAIMGAVIVTAWGKQKTD